MEPEGISVIEITLNLPNTHYYLRWLPAPPPLEAATRRAVAGAARSTAARLGWRIFAAGCDASAARLVFRTTAGNLDRGLDALLAGARNHAIHLVQPAAALPLVAGHVHARTGPDHDAAEAVHGAPERNLPEIHYGLFMGERPWADRMLELMSRCAAGGSAAPGTPASLGDFAGDHSSSRAAIAEAYSSGRFSLKAIAEHFDMHFSEVSAIINGAVQEP